MLRVWSVAGHTIVVTVALMLVMSKSMAQPQGGCDAPLTYAEIIAKIDQISIDDLINTAKNKSVNFLLDSEKRVEITTRVARTYGNESPERIGVLIHALELYVCPAEEPDLRIVGSNTMGAELMPALAAAFLRQEGYEEILLDNYSREQMVNIFGQRAGKRFKIQVLGTGSLEGFNALRQGEGRPDIVMSSIKVDKINGPDRTELERQRDAGNGDLNSDEQEHLVAGDRIHIIVNRLNTVDMVDEHQVRSLFDGSIVDWSAVGGASLQKDDRRGIYICTRDEHSGTYKEFTQYTGIRIKFESDKTRRVGSHLEEVQCVIDDLRAIGYVSEPFVGGSKALIVRREDAKLLGYGRDLLLYHASREALGARLAAVERFVEFALSERGQAVVAKAGFSIVRTGQRERSERCDRPIKEIGHPVIVRFGHDSYGLAENLPEDQLRRPEGTGSVLVRGYTDSSGLKAHNDALAAKRAEAAAAIVQQRNPDISSVEAIGCGELEQGNETAEGRERNRRAEILWIKN